jgi:2-C-methyl-D-erythritol 4-phosphate cytidylyltransferase
MRYAVIAAAGRSRRFGGDIAKIKMPLNGGTVLARAVAPFLSCEQIAAVYVVVAPDDAPLISEYQSAFANGGEAAKEKIFFHPVGANTRAASVAGGLKAIQCEDSDWILVHDAARPCLSNAALCRLINEVGDDAVGGLLALPLADALKQGGEDFRVAADIARADKYLAQTPQMFRAGILRKALRAGGDFADEAEAVGALGYKPLLVIGDANNIKITRPDDLRLAAAILRTE